MANRRAWWLGILILLVAVPALATPRVPKVIGPGGAAAADPPGDGGANPSVAGLYAGAGGNSFTCTGSLIHPMYILTAAHCDPNLNTITRVQFESPAGVITQHNVNLAMSTVHPNFNATNQFENDILVLKLTTNSALPVLPIFMGTNEMGMVGTLVGWGNTQNGNANVKRSGTNTVDSIFFFGNRLKYDYDNPGGDSAIGAGDSGGPTFKGGAVMGVHSYGNYMDGAIANGDVWVDTRVSSFKPFILGAIPEPSTALLLGGGFLGLAALTRRLRSA